MADEKLVGPTRRERIFDGVEQVERLCWAFLSQRILDLRAGDSTNLRPDVHVGWNHFERGGVVSAFDFWQCLFARDALPELKR